MNYTNQQIRVDAFRRALVIGLGAQLVSVPALFAQDSGAASSDQKPQKQVIVGSNIPSAETESAAPVTVYDQKQIDRSSSATVNDFIRRTPASNFGGFSGVNNNTQGTGGATAVSLRGIGPEATLVLLNGRRVATIGAFSGAADTTFVDLNNFALGLIGQIEILKDGASAIYGADAVGGVVNLKTKKGLKGGEISGQYGDTTHDDDMSRKVGSVVWGASTEKTDVLAGFSYLQQNALYNRDRGFSKSSDQSARGGANAGSPNNNPGYFAVPRDNPVLVESGIELPPGDSPTVLVSPGRGANGSRPVSQWYAGTTTSLGNDPAVGKFDFNQGTIAVGERETFTSYFNAEHMLIENSRLSLFGEVYFNKSETQTGLAPGPITNFGNEGITIPASNVYNPFGVDISGASRYRPTEAGPRATTLTTDYFRLVGGLKGNILEKVDWEGAFFYNDSRSTDVGSYVSRTLFNNILNLPGADAYNPFASSQAEFAHNNAVIGQAQAGTTTRFTSRLYGGDFKLRGEAFELPAGPVGWAAGMEYRVEDYTRNPDGLLAAGDLVGFFATDPEPPSSNKREVFSGYAEASIPILSEKQNLKGFHAVTLTAAGRYETYDDIGDTAKPKFGVTWFPFDKQFLLRGTYSQGYSAPSLIQLNPNFKSQGGLELFDKLPTSPNFNQALETSLLTTGNSKLKPEDSENVTLGFVYSPKQIKNLTLHADLWLVDRTGIVGNPNWQAIIDNNPLDPRINRDPGTGEIIDITSGLQNGGRRQTRGIDFGIDYLLTTETAGNFELRLDATYTDKFKLLIPGDTVAQEAINQGVESTGASDAYVQWQGRGSLFWTYRKLELGATASYIHGFDEYFLDYDPNAAPGSVRLHPVGAYWRLDLRATYQLPWDTTISVACENALDNDPPFSAFSSASEGYVTQLYDPTGRFVSVTLKKVF